MNEPAAERSHGVKLDGVISTLVMRAEVIIAEDIDANEDSTGPRVLLDVLPLAADGSPVEFDGRLSLMFRDPKVEGKAGELARWDFEPEELMNFVCETSHGNPFAFPLQLPARIPTDGRTELWVRFAPTQGRKFLHHAALDLSRSARLVFDQRVRPKKVDYSVKPTTHEVAFPVEADPISSRPEPDGWQTARPGSVVQGAPESEVVVGVWRTATQPIPLVESHSARPDPLDAITANDRYGPSQGNRTATHAIPHWLPERPRDVIEADAKESAPPAWSAVR
jgi:hypothetical protein